MSTSATIGSGAIFKIGTTPVAEIIGITPPELTQDAVEATHMDSTSREYIPGLKDGGEIGLEFNYTAGGYAAMLALRTAGVAAAVSIEAPTGDVWAASAILTALGAEIPIDDRMTGSATLKVTGDVTFTADA